MYRREKYVPEPHQLAEVAGLWVWVVRFIDKGLSDGQNRDSSRYGRMRLWQKHLGH
jgi:hypothetical protein